MFYRKRWYLKGYPGVVQTIVVLTSLENAAVLYLP